MRCVLFLLFALLTAGCWKNTSQPAAADPPGHNDNGEHVRTSPIPRVGTPVVFSPDGRFALTNGPSLWELASGRRIREFEGHKNIVHSVALSSDGKSALSASEDGTVKLWEVMTAKEFLSLTGHQGGVHCVTFSPDGKRALSGGFDGTVRLWDLTTGAEIHAFRTVGRVRSLAFSSTGKYAASMAGPIMDQPGAGVRWGAVQVWDIAGGKLTWEFTQDLVHVVAFSPDGSRLALGGPRLRVCDAATGRQETVLDLGVSVWSLAYLPDGEHILTTGEDGLPRLWDLKHGRIERTYRWDGDGVGYVAVAPDGKQALSDTSVLWDLTSGEWVATLGKKIGAHKLTVNIAFSPDGQRALTAFSGPMVLWDLASGKPLRTFANSLGAGRLAFSPDGKLALSAGTWSNLAQLWDVQTGKEIRQFEGLKAAVACVAFSPDGRLALAGGNPDREDGQNLKLWEVATGKEIRGFKGHEAAVGFAAFLPDGKRILSADPLEGIYLWEARTGKLLRTLQARGAREAAVSPDGKFALFYGGGRGCRSTLWDMTSAQDLYLLPEELGGISSIAALSPGGKLVLYAGGGGLLYLLDVKSGKTVRLVPPHEVLTGDWAVAFTPDGRLVRFLGRLVDPMTGDIELTSPSTYNLNQFRKYADR